MNRYREAFERKFPIPAHWIEFDEKRNKYYCPYVADAKAFEYQAMWEVWQSRQSEFDAMTEALLNQTQLIAKKQAEIEEKDKRIEELESRLKAVHALARMRSAVITADRWFTLKPHIKNAIKCLDRKEKALRGVSD